MMLPLLLLAVPLMDPLSAIPVDNGVDGMPEIQCGPTSITVNFTTRTAFRGHVYVKGLYDQQECRSDESGNNQSVAVIKLSFDTCNVARTRSLNPRGVFVIATVVISFHPMFITKVDRAYRIQCFYMEADKTVSTQIEVSEMTTAFQNQTISMPDCKYELLEGPDGKPVQFATVGQPIYHKWTCNSRAVDTFCAVVHSCFVDDGNGDTVQILNDEGCALDKYLLNNLEYPTDLIAGQEAHVYKYADRSQLFYQCQITITVKEPNSECERPKCLEPVGFDAIKQDDRTATPEETALDVSPTQLRLLKKRAVGYDTTMDVRTGISTLDITDQETVLPEDLRHRIRLQYDYPIMITPLLYGNDSVCISLLAFFLLIVITLLIIALFIIHSFYSRKQKL